MRRTLIWLVAILLLLPVVVVVAVLVGLNTDPGRALAAREVAALTHDQVRLEGLAGRFPDQLRLRHLELHDAQGPWLQADDVRLVWSPLALLHKQALVHTLDAADLHVLRLPASAPSASPAAPGKPFSLPVRVTVEHLVVARLDLGAPVLGVPASLSAAGEADVASLEEGRAELTLRGEGAGPASSAYTLKGALTPDAIDATLEVQDPAQGLVARVAHLPDIGPLHLAASVQGPKAALATTLALTAGPLAAAAHGVVDLPGARATIDVTGRGPAMTPAPGVSWEGVTLDAHIAGPFTAPDASGHLRADSLQSAGASLKTLTATLAGNAGQAMVHATLDTLRLPGPNPELLAAAPIQLDAATRLDDPSRPVTFTLSHPLLTARGLAHTGPTPDAEVTLSLPDLGPLGALAGLDLAGHSQFTLRTTQSDITAIEVDGTLAVDRAPAPAAALIGQDARLGLSARLSGSTVALSRLTLDGAAVHFSATGSSRPEGLDANTHAVLDNLALLAPSLAGTAQLDAHVHGLPNALATEGTLVADIAAGSLPRTPVRLEAALTGLPGAPAGHLTGRGTLAGAPLTLALDATRAADGTLQATIQQADWRSIHAEGALALAPGATLPTGQVAVRAPHLEDLRVLLGQPLGGALTATAQLASAGISVEAEARNAGLPTAHVAHASLKAQVANPLDRPTVAATLVAEGIATPSVTGAARLEVAGPETALGLKATATLDVQGTQAQAAAAATLDATAQQLRLLTLQVTAQSASVKPETARLLAPATIHYGAPVSVDRLRLGLGQAVLDVAGRLAPTLDASVTLRTPASIAAIVLPDMPVDGSIALDAHLTGTPAQPGGTVRLSATALHSRTGSAAALAPASLVATAQLGGGRAQIDARLTGPAQIGLAGQVPLGQGAVNLRATGALDVGLLNPLLNASGRSARGRLALDASVTGPLAAPAIQGQAQLSGGELQDFTQGVHLTDLAGTVRAEGQSLRAALTGRAGPGTIALAGTVGLAAAHPVDLTVTLRNARPLASDTIAATLDADLTLRGPASGPQAAGHVLIRRAELQIPRTLPASVVVLDVRRPGDKPAAPGGPATSIPLDLAIDAPNSVFLRGRGVDAELAGSLRIRGSSTAPQVSGGLQLRRGSISLAGTTLDFSRGRVGFDGTGVGGRIDPTLDFAATSVASSVTATLAITGYVSKPKIALTSVPDLPQDEVLAYLLFKRSAKELGPFQLAEIAAGLADLTGVGGGGLNPLESVRKGLGLDRLSVGAAANPSGAAASTSAAPTVEAGRYVANGVYVGARQGTTGGQTGATVQIDITKGLKLETDVGTGQGSNQVGVTYQFEY